MSDLARRSWAKAVTWRLTASAATFLISWAIATDLTVASSIAGVQLIVNFLLYFVHERVWDGISWGRGTKYGPKEIDHEFK